MVYHRPMCNLIKFHKSSLSSNVRTSAFDMLAGVEQFQGGGILYNRAIERLAGDYQESYYLTCSCTAALEMVFMNIAESNVVNDTRNKVLLPSFAFSSCANAILRAGLVPVFGDVNSNLNLCLDEVSSHSFADFCAVLALDYAGYPCLDEATVNGLRGLGVYTVMDSAQSFGFYELGKPPAAGVDYQVFSFHDTKTISTGEGGLLICNSDTVDLERMTCLFEKGTNRKAQLRGDVAKYQWLSTGGSFILSDINVALLLAQIDSLTEVIEERQEVFRNLKRFFDEYDILIETGECGGASHFFWLLAHDLEHRNDLVRSLKDLNIQATTHYEPLHLSPYGSAEFETFGAMKKTNNVAEVLLRLPTHDKRIGDLIAKL